MTKAPLTNTPEKTDENARSLTIGVLGAGPVGKTLATKFAAKGHQVSLANSRGPDSVAAGLGAPVANLTPSTTSAALRCDIVFLTVPWTKVPDLLGADQPKEGRILVDVTNIFLRYPPDALIDDLQGDSGSEIVARMAPQARVVKAFNTLPFATLFAPPPEGAKRVLFIAGDDAPAIDTVAALIEELGLFPLPLGSLAQAGRQMELGGPLSGLELFTPA